MRSENQSYVPAVDHLRAYAALLIVAYHGNQVLTPSIGLGQLWNPSQIPTSKNPILAVLYEGHTAVALFLVLSGYIFTRGALNTPKNIPYGKFLANRLLRIYPIYILLVVIGIYTFAESFDLAALVQTILPLANLKGAANYGAISAMFWTVSVEFQFYLIFPLLFVFMRKRGLVWIAQLILLMIVFRWIAVEQGANPHELSYRTIVGRLDQFLIGMALAYVLEKKPKVLSQLWMFPVAALAMVGVLYAYHRNGGYPSTADWKILWPTIEGTGWAFVIGTYLSFARLIPEVVSKLIAKFGTVSYSFYLIHYLIIVTVIDHEWWIEPTGSDQANAFLTTALIVVPLTTALASLSFATVESPFLKLRLSYSSKKDD